MSSPVIPPGLDPIQMLWVRGNLSRMELLSIRSFLAHGHPVHLYHYGEIPNAPRDATLLDGSAIMSAEFAPEKPVEPMGKGSMTTFANFFRYQLLHSRGGWWADMDIVCTHPWRFPQSALTASTLEGHHGQIANNCVMRFPVAHPVMAACVEVCAKLDPREVIWGQTGPALVHDTLKAQGLLHLLVEPAVFCPVPWNGSWQLTRSFWKQFTPGAIKLKLTHPHLWPRFTAGTVSVHLWKEMWRRGGLDSNGRYPASSLYEKLQRKWNP